MRLAYTPYRIKPRGMLRLVITIDDCVFDESFILSACTAAGLSQTEFAEKLKAAQANIARLERGGSMPSVRTLRRIAKATDHKLFITFTRSG